MIYLIGGTPRVGKSTLAALILERDKISNISTDVLRNVLDYSSLQVGIKDFEPQKQSEAFFPYFLPLLKILQNKYQNYVVEGDLFYPEQIVEIKERINLKCCFLGSSNITLEDLKQIDSKLDWVSKLPPEKQADLPREFIERSKMFETEAPKHGFSYFDISPNRQAALESAYNELMK